MHECGLFATGDVALHTRLLRFWSGGVARNSSQPHTHIHGTNKDLLSTWARAAEPLGDVALMAGWVLRKSDPLLVWCGGALRTCSTARLHVVLTVSFLSPFFHCLEPKDWTQDRFVEILELGLQGGSVRGCHGYYLYGICFCFVSVVARLVGKNGCQRQVFSGGAKQKNGPGISWSALNSVSAFFLDLIIFP